MQEWVEQELVSADLGDPRRDRRFRKLVEQCSRKPDGTFNEACPSQADKKAAYRFVENEAIAPEALREPHYEATWRRVAGHERVLVVQDTSGIDLTAHGKTRGLGPLDCGFTRGFLVHSGLAVTVAGEPLGLVHQEVWIREEEELGESEGRRDRPWSEKESYKWQRTVETVTAHLPDSTEGVVVGDRESDVYGLLACVRPERVQLLVRSAQNRKVAASDTCLHKALQSQPVAGQMVVQVVRAKDREPRQAMCDIRHGEFTLSPPRHADRGVPKVAVKVWAVSVTEHHAPKGQTPVTWILLATWPIQSLKEAVEAARLYSLRWLVERYHFVLKSGCRIEQAQLQAQDRMERLLALYTIVAWRLLSITYRARTDPSCSCEVVFTPVEWKVLYLKEHGKPYPETNNAPPTLKEAVLWTAKLGGYWGRKNDPPPGVKVLWRGLTRLPDIVLGYILASESRASQTCG